MFVSRPAPAAPPAEGRMPEPVTSTGRWLLDRDPTTFKGPLGHYRLAEAIVQIELEAKQQGPDWINGPCTHGLEPGTCWEHPIRLPAPWPLSRGVSSSPTQTGGS